MPRHLISDAHEWINEIPTVPIYYLAKQGDGLIEKRSAEDYKVYGSFNGRHTIIEYDIYN